MIDIAFPCLDTVVNVLVDETWDDHEGACATVGEQRAVDDVCSYLVAFERRLSLAEPDSYTSRLNRDPREIVPARRILRELIGAAIWSAHRSGGLIDPASMYARGRYAPASTAVNSPAPLADALAAAPPRHPAAPHPAALWRLIEIDDDSSSIRRPAGMALDCGTILTALAADQAAATLTGHGRYRVDIGGDIVIGGEGSRAPRREIALRHPLDGAVAHRLQLVRGAVATTGVHQGRWRTADGGHAHQLRDPLTGEPAWTGVLAATAVGRSALEARTLATTAVLAGPRRGRRILTDHGGVLFLDDGRVDVVQATWRARLRLRRPPHPTAGLPAPIRLRRTRVSPGHAATTAYEQ